MAGMPMQDTGAHLEGRIAFLRAELGITEAQASQWEAFAQAMRDSASKLKQAPSAAPQSASEPVTFLVPTEN
jgi:LTXXQ motif family protein